MSSPIHLQIKSMYKDFSPKEQAIADYIVENPIKVSHSSISDLAAELGIADSQKHWDLMVLRILNWLY